MARNEERMNPREFGSRRDNRERFHDEEYDHYQYRDGFGRSTKNDREMKFERNPQGNHGQFQDEEYNHYQYRDGYGRSSQNDRRNQDDYDAYRGIERNYNLGNGTSMRRSSSGNDFSRNESGSRSYGLGSYHENDFVRNYPNHAYDYGRSQERGHYGKGPKGWKRSDERIRDEVCEALNDSYSVDASDIDVSVKEGLVTLAGTVDARGVKLDAERCAERVRGVLDVRNELRVRPQEGSEEFKKSGKLS